MTIHLFARPALSPIPSGFSIRQKLSLHALIFSIEAIEISYNRLVNGLKDYGDGSHQSDDRFVIEMLLQAWTIVDNSHRFYKIISGFPGKRNVVNVKGSRFRPFLDCEEFRNYYEHMEAIPEGRRSTMSFGGIAWFAENGNKVFLILNGVVGQAPINAITISPKDIKPIGAITLTTGPDTINISDLANALSSIVSDITAGLGQFRPDVQPT